MGIVTKLEPFYISPRNCRTPLVAGTLKGSLRRLSRPLHQKAPLTREDLLLLRNLQSLLQCHNDLLFMIFPVLESPSNLTASLCAPLPKSPGAIWSNLSTRFPG